MDAGDSRHAVAARLGLSPSCVIKWMVLYRKTGSVKPGKIGGHVLPKIRGAHREWVLQQILVPTLRPGDLVIMDNLGAHKGEAVRTAIKAAGARLIFLPAYSPNLTPIEQVFAKLKHLLRKAKERSVEATWQRIGAIIPSF